MIERLPRGYDQPLGKRFEDGVDLSGGEWQKIAIARAYMRDAAVLILDEPTAALDARSEYEVFQRFRDLSRGRTAILISHRFSTVRMADRILVLEHGRVARGRHPRGACSPPAGATPSCSTCRRPAIAERTLFSQLPSARLMSSAVPMTTWRILSTASESVPLRNGMLRAATTRPPGSRIGAA